MRNMSHKNSFIIFKSSWLQTHTHIHKRRWKYNLLQLRWQSHLLGKHNLGLTWFTKQDVTYSMLHLSAIAARREGPFWIEIKCCQILLSWCGNVQFTHKATYWQGFQVERAAITMYMLSKCIIMQMYFCNHTNDRVINISLGVYFPASIISLDVNDKGFFL